MLNAGVLRWQHAPTDQRHCHGRYRWRQISNQTPDEKMAEGAIVLLMRLLWLIGLMRLLMLALEMRRGVG